MEFSWLSAFDNSDLEVFYSEFREAVAKAKAGGNWGNVSAVIHEWEESGHEALSGILDDVLPHHNC